MANSDLSGFSPEDPKAAREFCQSILASGPAAVAEICSGLKEPGQGEDPMLRLLIHGLALEAGRAPGLSRQNFLRGLDQAAAAPLPASCLDFMKEQSYLAGAPRPSTAWPRWHKVEPASAGFLLKALKSSQGLEREQILGQGLELAERLRDKGFRSESIGLYSDLYKELKPEDPPPAGLACLSGLASLSDAKALEELREALKSPDPAQRAAVRSAAAAAAGSVATRFWVQSLGLPAYRADSLDILRQRGDARALPQVKAWTADRNDEVRDRALEALAGLGGAEALPDLLSAWESGPAGDRKLIGELVRGLPGEKVTASLSEAARMAGPESPDLRIFLIQSLAARNSKEDRDMIWGAGADPDPKVRAAALEALGILAEADLAPKLAAFLLTEKEAPVREAGIKSLAQVANREPDRDKKALPLLAIWPQADSELRLSLIQALGGLGGREGLAKLRLLLDSRAEGEKDAALRALGEGPDGEALPDLVGLASASGTLTGRVLALRGACRLLGLPSTLTEEERVRLVEKLYKSASRPEDRKTVLGALPKLPAERTLALARGALKDPTLKEEAEAALDLIQKGLERLHKNEGFILNYEVSGPYAVPGKNGSELFGVAFDPEAGKGNWKSQTVESRGEDTGLLDFMKLSGAGNDKAAYARARLLSPRKTEARLEMGSDDGLKVWLNGALVHANNASRGHEFGNDLVPVKFKKGENLLLFKVVNGGGDWSLSCRIRDPKGSPLPGLQVP